VNVALGRANLNRDNLFYALTYSNIIDPLLIEDRAERGISIHWTGLLDRHIFGFYTFQGHILVLWLKDLYKTF